MSVTGWWRGDGTTGDDGGPGGNGKNEVVMIPGGIPVTTSESPPYQQVTYWRSGPSGASYARTSPPSSATWPSSNATTLITSEVGPSGEGLESGGWLLGSFTLARCWLFSWEPLLFLALSPEVGGTGDCLESLDLGLCSLLGLCGHFCKFLTGFPFS